MPQLSNPQHEVFAQQLAGGATKTEAARRARFSENGIANQGHRLAKRQDVQQRIAELSAFSDQPDTALATPDGRSLAFTTKPWVVEELVGIHRLCRRKGEYGVAVQALRTLAQLGGHLNDGSGSRSPNSNQNKALDALMLSAAQLNELLRQRMSDAEPDVRRRIIDAVPELASMPQEPEPLINEPASDN